MTEHIITYDFSTGQFSNLPTDSTGEKKFVFAAEDSLRDAGGTVIEIQTTFKKLKAKKSININWNRSKPTDLHISISKDDYENLEDTDENLVYFVYGDNEKNISDYEPYKGDTIKGILDRIRTIEEEIKRRNVNGFTTIWDIQNTSFTFPAFSTISNNVATAIDWGDGTISDFQSSQSITHRYSTPGIYTIKVEADVNTIKDEAFKDRADLLEVKLNRNITSIGSYSFKGCASLYSFIFPNNFENIGAAAFNMTPALRQINIPDSVTTIGNAAFWTAGIESITIPEGITSITSICDHCTNLVEVKLPESLTYIGSYTFNYCTSLKYIEIPANVRTIQYDAFANTYDITIRIHRAKDSISGSPWRSSRATIVWDEQ